MEYIDNYQLPSNHMYSEIIKHNIQLASHGGVLVLTGCSTLGKSMLC